MRPTEDQENALDKINDWFHNSSERTFRLGGLAGTGKSWMVPIMHERLGIPVETVQYVAPTNKATLVVQSRLDNSGINANARTVHKTYYQKTERHCDNCPLAESLKNICHGLPGYNHCGCFLDFAAKMEKDKSIKLVICDESSMINREVYDDILRTCGSRVKILFIGDHGQLEPVEENFEIVKTYGKFDLMHKPDYVLTNIQRQAADSPILQLAYKARHGEPIPYDIFGEGVSKIKYSTEIELDTKAEDVIAITYFSDVDKSNPYHKGRISVNELNRIWRHSIGIDSNMPVTGDRIVCRDFIRSLGIPKGSLATVINVEVHNYESYLINAALDDGRHYEGLVSSKQFYRNKAIWGLNHLDKWDYGYALTCHTAQGSEFDSVIVFEPSAGFIKWLGSDSYSRWLYTAITRAKRNLLLVG